MESMSSNAPLVPASIALIISKILFVMLMKMKRRLAPFYITLKETETKSFKMILSSENILALKKI